MHPQAHDWVASHRTDEPLAVLDIGGRNINGSVRDLFRNADYTALDILPGDGVDIVADAATWVPDREYDAVVCCEVFEHTAVWPEICATAFKALKPGGKFVATCAGPGRGEHSAIDGQFHLHPGEHYGNVSDVDLNEVLVACGFHDITTDQQIGPCDTRAVAWKPSKVGD
jgi:SAM-dependent methyltransferase